MRRAFGIGMLAALVLAAACRDGAELFTTTDRGPLGDENPWRLTYNVAEDRSPVWAAGGDSLYYSAEDAGPFPRPIGVLQSVGREGGVARPLLGAVQVESAARRWLTAPTPAPDGRRMAYVEVWGHRIADLCFPIGTPGTFTSCDVPWESLVPMLTEVRIRIREYGALSPVERDPELSVPLDFLAVDTTRHPFGLEGVFHYPDHPFHRLNRQERTRFYRPSWSPAGERLALSDGLRVLVWRLGEPNAVPVPGTEDGISPAWSPDGEWIAFSRPERADSALNQCLQSVFGIPTCLVEQRTYRLGARRLLLVRPDGSEVRDLTEGEDPAWSPDGQTIYFRSGDRLWRMGRDGGAREPLADTKGGREPAVSPDGRHLAFARQTPAGDYDIWVLALE